MYELVHLKGSSYYIESPAKIGLVKLTDDTVCLIDSGNDKNAARKVMQLLDANGWRLSAIYNTHSHADHVGGNKYLHSQTGCRIYAQGVECAFARHHMIETAFLWGGFPVKELLHKFLMAQDSPAEYLTPEVLPEGWSIIDLPGHFFSMVGFRTPDNVVYLADCLPSAKTLAKYQITFLYDVGAYLSTLEAVKTLKADVFVPSHAPVSEDISELVQINIDKVNEIADIILEICRTPMNFDAILQRVFTRLNLTMTFEQYVLVGSTLKSYLSWLKDNGRVKAYFADNLLLWEAEA